MTLSTRVALGAIAAALAAPAWAQDAPASGDAPPPVPSEVPAPDKPEPVAGRQVFTPADFTRFAPKNAYDMIVNVPGFSIRENEQLRGLGQATGNVLFNGERPSNKSDQLFVQLQRIPASTVVRIEIVDGATLALPGLSGQVANVVFKSDSFSGQFAWKPQDRAHFTDPLFTRAQISASGKAGKLQYEVGLDNNDSGRSGAGGLTRIYDAAGKQTEIRNDIWHSSYDSPKGSVKLTMPFNGGSLAHLNGSYQRTYSHYHEISRRFAPLLPDRDRFILELNDTWNYEIGGDYEFGFGPGRLKLIGLNRKSHEPYLNDVVTDFVDATPTTGDRFAQVGNITEKIARAEYTWKMLGGDWQAAAEGAFNKLTNVARLGTFDPVAGEFVETPFPEGSGGVMEDRYEGSLSYSRPLSKTLSLQILLAAEKSKLAQSGINGLVRNFFRPKGTVSLAWKPRADLDVSVKLRRRVGQLSFYDFLAKSFIDDNNQNAGNNRLVPQQDWTLEFEINKRWGPWGSSKLHFYGRQVEDYVTIVPVSATDESVGNVPRARVRVVELNSTINFDPIGLKGAKLDIFGLWQKAYYKDPYGSGTINYNGLTDRQLNLDFRYDIPQTDWAVGSSLNYSHTKSSFRRNSIDRIYEGPVFANFYVENKNVFGLTVAAGIDNIFNARSVRDRTVFADIRSASPVVFVEKRDRLIGPIFFYKISGTF